VTVVLLYYSIYFSLDITWTCLQQLNRVASHTRIYYIYYYIYERFIVHSDVVISADASIVLDCYSELYCHVFIIIIILFIMCWFIYFFHLAFCMHVSSCVRGEIITPNPINYFWDVTIVLLHYSIFPLKLPDPASSSSIEFHPI
jgi:hypothetical protein